MSQQTSRKWSISPIFDCLFGFVHGFCLLRDHNSALPRSAILSRSGQQLGPRSGVHQQGFLSYGPVVILVLVLQSPQCRSFSTINFLDAYWQRELPSTNTGSGITAFLGVFALLCRNQGCFFSSSSQESRLLSKELFWQPHSNASLP